MTSAHEITSVLARLSDTRDQVNEILANLDSAPGNDPLARLLVEARREMNNAVRLLQDARTEVRSLNEVAS